jgi:Domain of unknown function (DUF5621)/T6SS, Phospholipase effector Tle1-like, catalytic domain
MPIIEQVGTAGPPARDTDIDNATPGRVANLLFQGTDQHRTNVDDIITRFADAMLDDGESQFVHLLDGIGGKPAKGQGKEHPAVGTYQYQPDPVIPGAGTKHRKGSLPDTLKRELGSYLAVGLEDNIIEALQYIDQLRRLDKMPDTINLTGFSRGAYTALVTARILSQMYPNIKLNLFLIEPVPGPGFTDESKANVIPANVERATIVLQRDENRPEFSPLDQSKLKVADPRQTHVAWECLPGGHSAATAFKSEETADIVALTTALMFEHATASGTRFKNDTAPAFIGNPEFIDSDNNKRDLPAEALTESGQLKLYHRIDNERDAYEKVARIRNYSENFPKRKFTKRKHMESYVSDSDFFVTQRHRELFQKHLPRTFDYLFRLNQLNSDWVNLANELAQFQKQHPDVFQAMQPALNSRGIYFENLSRAIENNGGTADGLVIPTGIFPRRPRGRQQFERNYVLEGKPVAEDGLSCILYKVNEAVGSYLGRKFSLRHRDSSLRARILHKEIQAILEENNPAKEAHIRRVIKDAIQDLKDMSGDKKLLSALEDALDDASNLKHEIDKMVRGNLRDKKLANTVELFEVFNNFNKRLADINENGNLSDTEKKDRMLSALQKFSHQVYDVSTSKSVTQGLRDDIYQLLQAHKQPADEKVGKLGKKVEKVLRKEADKYNRDSAKRVSISGAELEPTEAPPASRQDGKTR